MDENKTEEQQKREDEQQAKWEKQRKEVIDPWFEEAKKVHSKESFMALYEKVMSYPHDYSTIVEAVAVMGIAACGMVDKHNTYGGISGFQASAVAWTFWQRWLSVAGPMRMLKYDDMLFPQYEDKFRRTISSTTWEWLREEAKKNIKEHQGVAVALAVVKHWESIADGVVPFGYEVEDEG